MSTELIAILAVGVSLLAGLGGLVLTVGGWLRGDLRELRAELLAVGRRLVRVEGLIEGAGLTRGEADAA